MFIVDEMLIIIGFSLKIIGKMKREFIEHGMIIHT